MKITVTESVFCEQFKLIRPENFSRLALEALFEYYELSEEENGEEMEFNVVEICRNWTEYESVFKAAEHYGFKADENDDKRADTRYRKALEFLRGYTWVLELDNDHVVVLNS